MNESSNKQKILIADDEASLRTLVRAIISSEGEYDIEEAIDGDDTLAKVKSFGPDLLILDVMMPGQSGFEVCEKIKKNSQSSSPKIIILTAKAQNTDSDWAKTVGADHFFTKPFDPIEFIEVVKKLQ